MMRSLLPLHRDAEYASSVWLDSKIVPGVRFAVRKPSLAQRINLLERIRELTRKHEFLLAGGELDQVEAALSDLLVRRLYLEWGLIELHGLKIDRQQAGTLELIERGPEDLLEEIVEAVKNECSLSDDERKNS